MMQNVTALKRQTMNYRERVIRTVQFKDVDELPFRHAYGLMPGGLENAPCDMAGTRSTRCA